MVSTSSSQVKTLPTKIGLGIVSAFLAGLLAGCSVSGSTQQELRPIQLGAGKVEESPTDSPSEAPVDKKPIRDGFAELEVEDQSGDGMSVQIEEVRIGFPVGFVVILDSDGNILGWAKLTDKSQPVSVELGSKLTRNAELLAKLFADDGDSNFSPDLDSPIQLSDDGKNYSGVKFTYRLNN